MIYKTYGRFSILKRHSGFHLVVAEASLPCLLSRFFNSSHPSLHIQRKIRICGYSPCLQPPKTFLRSNSSGFSLYRPNLSVITYSKWWCNRQLHCSSIVSKMAANNIEPKTNGRFNGRINGVEGKTPFLIGVAGGTASGKSTVCKRIMEKLGQADVDHTQRQVVSISQDAFYKELTPSEKARAEKGQFNFDHPDAFNEELMYQTLKDILAGKKCEIPVYDYRTNSRCEGQFTTIYPADVVLFEGILVFYFREIRDLFHMKLFVDTDSDTRLARRVPRDINERGRDLEQVLNQYMNYVKPAFEEFCLPTKKFADVIIPRGADNTVAIDLIVQHIREFLVNRKLDRNESRVPPSPATSPVHGVRRPNTPDLYYKRPH